MWRSENGNITLTGTTRKVFREGAASLCWSLKHGGPLELGVRAFDVLERGPQVVLLERVVRAALLTEEEPPELHAAVEAAFVACFLGYRDQIMVPLEDPDEEDPTQDDILADLRRVAREVDLGWVPEDDAELDTDQWTRFLIELAERFMWDSDYAMGEAFDKLSPEEAAERHERMSIGDDYFSWRPPAVPEDQIEAIRERTLAVLNADAGPEALTVWSEEQLQEVARQSMDDLDVLGRIVMPLRGREPIAQWHRVPRALDVLRRDRLGGHRVVVSPQGSEDCLFQLDIDGDGTTRVLSYEPTEVVIDREANLLRLTLLDADRF
ncbi:hypothetical protein [Phycisphaera mikurensis]|uniref:Uncharacterized protein n=1 Tax=Phycisphaera mikurensis (strain NBRC 102666 / KCTC 22515 / FYK2301M01) TaxID=1142394 RepID=I0IJD1_PHYMF|nr:hypothetical protein [Phycisphaera mikurensis]MBB6443198.1 hypothetical protein [Phycisphaera mikurensis]BAM05369.1 hypothetical protein PSMK_p00070 [Phycisphaera mikurensis NBRC 102666]